MTQNSTKRSKSEGISMIIHNINRSQTIGKAGARSAPSRRRRSALLTGRRKSHRLKKFIDRWEENG